MLPPVPWAMLEASPGLLQAALPSATGLLTAAPHPVLPHATEAKAAAADAIASIEELLAL
jgi:hypothetical protein